MTAAEFAPIVRAWMRISTSASDDEITQCINASLSSLQSGGVDNLDLEDPLIQQAAKDYCKGYFGFDSDKEYYTQRFEDLKNSLAMNSTYSWGVNLRG